MQSDRLALTLALSPRRGNQQWPRLEKFLTSGHSPALEKILPLPGGEGRGEGEREFQIKSSGLTVPIQPRMNTYADEVSEVVMRTAGQSKISDQTVFFNGMLNGSAIRITMMKVRACSTKISEGAPAPSPREARAGRGLGRGVSYFTAPPLPGPLLHRMEEREWLWRQPRWVHPCPSVVSNRMDPA